MMRKTGTAFSAVVLPYLSEAPTTALSARILGNGVHSSGIFSIFSTSTHDTIHTSHVAIGNKKTLPVGGVRHMSTGLGGLRERLKDGPDLGDFVNGNLDEYSVYAPKPKV